MCFILNADKTVSSLQEFCQDWNKIYNVNKDLQNAQLESAQIWSTIEIWMDLETIIQIEVSQKDKSKYHVLMHVC